MVGQSASADDSAVFYDNLCAFQNSGPVGQGYLEESAVLSSTTVDPEYITAQFTNTGERENLARSLRAEKSFS